MLNTVYSVLLLLLHYIADLYDFAYGVWVYFKSQLISPADETLKGFDEIRKRADSLQKLPKHITVLLGTEEDPPYKDLVNIVLWSIAMGVPFISFYDCKGVLKKTEAVFREELHRVKKLDHHIIWHNNHTKTPRNGYSGKKIHIKLLSPQDGRVQFAGMCKKLAEDGVSVEKIDTGYLDDNLREYYEFPDPDLGIYAGNVFSLYDYPPWQVAVTEFLNVRSFRNINCGCFIDVLSRFSKCEQRLGK